MLFLIVILLSLVVSLVTIKFFFRIQDDDLHDTLLNITASSRVSHYVTKKYMVELDGQTFIIEVHKGKWGYIGTDQINKEKGGIKE